MTNHKQNGFTLVEIGIVLLVIGLIIGGVVTGENLIRNAQLRAVATETGEYIQAVSDFRDKYLALPGDFTGATALWGTTGGAGTQGTGTQTFDGNGDGRITTQAADNNNPGGQYEQFRAWQHLANAGMVDGSYSGVAGGGDAMKAVVGTNVPASKLPGGGYSLISLLSSEIGSNGVANHYTTNVNYMHMLQFGGASGAKSTIYGILTPAEAFSLDSKLDDGFPSTGKIMGPLSTSTYSVGCTTNAVPPVYNSGATGNNCSLLFLLGF